MFSSLLTPTSRRELFERDRQWRLKVILRLGTGVCALVGLSLFAAAIPTWNANFIHLSGPSRGDWADGMPIAALSIAFLYDILSTNYTLRRASPPHPVMSLVFDLLVWLSLVPALVFAGIAGLFAFWTPAVESPDGKVVCDALNLFAMECVPVLYSIGTLELGGIVSGGLTCVLHLIMFVLACIDVSRMRKRKATLKMSRQHDFHELYQRGHTPPPKTGSTKKSRVTVSVLDV